MASALSILAAAVLAVTVPPLAAPVPGPVVAEFDATGPYARGHRGVDLGAAPGTVVHAPAAGTVVYVGVVAGNLTVSIDAGGGIVVHLSYLARIEARVGARLRTGDPVGVSGRGHTAPRAGPSVHLGLEVDGSYVDPLPFLQRRHAVLVR